MTNAIQILHDYIKYKNSDFYGCIQLKFVNQ